MPATAAPMAGSRRLTRFLVAGVAACMAASTAGVVEVEREGVALATDDECSRDGASDECGLNALQLRGQKTSQRQPPPPPPGSPGYDEYIDGNNDDDDDDDDDDRQRADEDESADANWDPNFVRPWGTCGGDGYSGPTQCTKGFSCQHMTAYYAQCRPQVAKNWVKYNGSEELDAPSPAPMLTFYMYRAQADNNYPLENVNMGTLGGMMWYLHNEIVSCIYDDCDQVRHFGIHRITRWKVKTRATTAMYKAGVNFGIRYAYDSGQCTGPWPCDDQFAKYGYFVGCNNLSSGFPFPDFPVYYSGAWYSLPGSCGENIYFEKTQDCSEDQPGGHCPNNTDPTGQGTCTYSYEKAGEIFLDELEGLKTSYQEFKNDGGEEYNKETDVGVNMDFWNFLNNTEANAKRVKAADALFKRKYPDMPSDEEMPPPPCDFSLDKFFPDGLPTEENPALKRAARTRLGLKVDE
eukprot:CAMPEP_0176037966 /NCGR_PEP_ID=MMETSP0120_2-20121206/18812_1 /TAXON_ID=160619 /ORGANISM="Kryptoperidinium foliaceum, Strain CCMP 1326" /LENGTH=462 /DNA_ID=CAMNT_0017371357 /DNA_START=77 /DNA_END=1465 /DNA_ORIENTATION=-